MSRRFLLAAVAVALLTSACSRLGVGLPDCSTATRNPSSATVLTLQAVPTADYAPCINGLKLGWDEIEFEVESGLVTLEIGRQLSSFLEVRLTESCEVGDAVKVESGYDDIERYESVSSFASEIGITIVPTGERPRIHALAIAAELEDTTVDDRPLILSVDENIDGSVRARVNDALFSGDYVWIVSDLDIEEDTLELRRTSEGEGARGLSVDDALDRIEDLTPEASYIGQWYLVFNGGCITYDFDATGAVAETLEQDVAEAIGLYDNAELREAGRRAGFELLED